MSNNGYHLGFLVDKKTYTNISSINELEYFIDPKSDIIRYQSRDVIYPVLKDSGFVKRSGVSVSRTV